ncbi:MAG: hypothetical protein AAF376_08925 [Pseudomonadota bacterium]
MAETINPTLILAHARAWIGTPFAPRTALRGVSADCVGLIRGVWTELTGFNVPTPRWREDWAAGDQDMIGAGLSNFADPVPDLDPEPGHIVTYRIGRTNSAHVGIWTGQGVIHASETAGVSESGPLTGRGISSVWAFPNRPGCDHGDPGLTLDACVAVIYSAPFAGAYFDVMDQRDGTTLAKSRVFPDRATALAILDPIYPHIESVE